MPYLMARGTMEKKKVELIYQCTNCDCLIQSALEFGGDKGGEMRWSDGKKKKHFQWGHPELMICLRCKELLWLKKLKPLVQNRDKVFQLGWTQYKNAQPARWIRPKEAKELLKQKVLVNSPEEEYIRKHLWWGDNERIDPWTGDWYKTYNDGLDIRNDMYGEDDMAFYRANCRSLISIFHFALDKLLEEVDRLSEESEAEREYIEEFYSEDIHERIFMLCELYRNLGEFENASQMLKRVKGSKYAAIVRQIEKAIQRRNKFTFQLKNN
jgi:hypothetical protein